MSTIKADTIKNKKSLAINLPNKLKIGGFSVEQGYTASATEPSNPSIGDFWWDTANDKLYRYVNGAFFEIAIVPPYQPYGDKASRVGFGTTQSNSIHTYNLATTGNASDWKDLTRTSSARAAACSDAIYGLFCGGHVTGTFGGADVNNIDYYAFANNTNASDFGDLNSQCSSNSACSDGTTGVVTHGLDSYVAYKNSMDKVTIQTPGNATDFGDLVLARASDANQQISDGTTGIIAFGGRTNYVGYGIDSITIATPGNATDFGDTLSNSYAQTACGGGTSGRGLVFGGTQSARYKSIEYVTIATPGNSVDFGDMFSGVGSSFNGSYHMGSANNATRAVVSCSYAFNNMEYVTMDTTGNATDFGDQVSSTNVNAFQACTSGHP